jgi:glutaminyl-peptide cyclotransferase
MPLDNIMIRNKHICIPLIILCINLTSCQSLSKNVVRSEKIAQFDQQRAYQDLTYQVSLGPRTIGSSAHSTVVDWIYTELMESEWNVQLQTENWNGREITNVIGKRGENSPWIIVGAHYDSRFIADRDPNHDKRDQPVPGANDGASGVAVLMELARVIPSDLNKQIWLVFFDAEDNGNINGWEWGIGSGIFVDQLDAKPDAVVIVDMVGDKDLNIYKEMNSDPTLSDQIWMIAHDMGYHQFIQEYKYRIIDDHIPFLAQNIPATLIIDFDYPYWHTTQDDVDKISADSLAVVGNTMLNWLNEDP